jgi:transposase
MLFAGLDLSRRRLDVCILDDDGERLLEMGVSPDADALRTLTARVARLRPEPVSAAIESMTGARFVHDSLERLGWQVDIADAQRAKGLAPLVAKTDRIDAWVLAELARRELVPAIWLPDPGVRAERERARFRLHLVQHRTALKNRIHATLMSFGHPVPVSDLFGVEGRRRLQRMALPEAWAASVATSVEIIDELDRRIAAAEAELRDLGAEHAYVPLLRTIPGIGWVLATTIASEIGDIGRFRSAKQLVGYTGLVPFVIQSGERDRRGPLTKHGPRYLRWALIEAATHAARHPAYRERYLRTRRRLGKQRGPRVARVEVARSLATAIWHMLTKKEPFAPPAGPAIYLVA